MSIDKRGSRPGDRHKPRTGDRHKERHGSPYQAKHDFITIDGEGTTTTKIVGWVKNKDGSETPVYEHLYILLMASTGERLSNADGSALSTVQCFDFLLSLSAKYPHAIFTVFGASYDINCWMADVPREVLADMWNGRNNQGGVDDEEEKKYDAMYKTPGGITYSLSYRPRKSFTLHRWGKPPYILKEIQHKDETVSEKYLPNYDPADGGGSITIYDCFGFFQTRFVDALGARKQGYFTDLLVRENVDGQSHDILQWPDGLRIDLTSMKAMKNKRDRFTIAQLEQEIIPYCYDEVLALKRLMERLRGYLEEADLYLTRWDGAGACAGALLKRENIKDHIREDIPDKSLYHAQLCAYSGGRIELGQFGFYLGDVWNYDVISSYPSDTVILPSLTDGMWRKIKGRSQQFYSISHVRWSFDSNLPYFPLFFRDNDGSIYYPPTGEGWYWKPEVDAAMQAFESGKLSTARDAGELEILESWEFVPYSDVKPFTFISELFKIRKAWKQAGNAAEKAIKLSVNSVPGKLAQSLGGTEARKPPYHNIGLAGYVTSATRAKIFTAMMQAPEHIIMSATDGIYSLTPLDLPLGEELGQWECTKVDGIIAVQAGVYWGLVKLETLVKGEKRTTLEPTDEERTGEYFNEKFWCHEGVWYAVNPHYRGFDKGVLTPQMVVDAWENYHVEDLATHTVPVTATRFVTLGSALASKELWPFWRTWRPIVKDLQLLPDTKRLYIIPNKKPLQAHRKLLMTHARSPRIYYMTVGYAQSQPYKLSWDREEPLSLVDGVDMYTVNYEMWESEV